MKTFRQQLVPFDAEAALPIEIDCVGELLKPDVLKISYQLTGSLENIALDAPVRIPTRTDDLWQRTCFELFISPAHDSRYWEYNLAPSGNWAIYGFEDYREGRFDELSIKEVVISATEEANQFTLTSCLNIPHELVNQKLQIGLSVVVQGTKGDIYYYALEHTEKNADFHAADSFNITVQS